MQHHRTPDSSMGRRTYLALTSAAVVGAVGVGSIPTTADDDPAPDDTDIGGGDGYDDTVSPEDADIIVSTREELLSAIENTIDGETIYVDDDAEIDPHAPNPQAGTYPPHCMGRSDDPDERAGAE
ncbi:MAG: hypothetical protein IH933_04000, partial [Euryarchaeota archaeon]|nr:hypothetical protein [Euryarchaeota archaeon]